MNFKLRPIPIIISIVISSVVLFGGWFIYHSMALKQPLSNLVQNIDGVEHAEMDVEKDRVVIDFNLALDASLREIMQQIQTEGSSVIDQRTLKVNVNNPSSRELDQWWSTALFDVAQAMETKQYSQIPSQLNVLKENLPNLEVTTEMDLTHVYIRLVHGNDSKFIMLPRTPAQLEVSTNE